MCPERSKSIFGEVLSRWSWMNPYKYYILGTILANMPFREAVGEDFNAELFLEGLSTSLKHRNLLSPGQFLFKSLMKHEVVDISNLVKDILLKRSLLERDNFINQWLCYHQDLDKLYEGIKDEMDDVTWDDEYLPIRRAFREQMAVKELAHDTEGFADMMGMIEGEPILTQHYYDILIHRLTKGLDVKADVAFLKELFECITLETNTGVRQYIFKRLPLILEQLARRNRDESEESEEIIEFFSWMQYQINEGYMTCLQEPGNYPAVIFILRLLETLLKFFSGDKKHALTKNSNFNANIQFREYLARKGLNFTSGDTFHTLWVLISESPFDDVQELACQLICEFFDKAEFQDKIQNKFRMKQDLDSPNACRLYARILLQWGEDLLDRVESFIKTTFENFRKDPFASVHRNDHIFYAIECLTECLVIRPPQGEKLSQLVDLCAEITEEVLKFLNHTGEFEEAPSFEVMEESLQVLIDKSQVKHWKSPPEARKELLLSLWMTLRACGDFSAAAAKILVKDSPQLPSGSKIETCLKINTMILQRCRHKGAIEAAGLSLGRIVREISGQDSEILRTELENLLAGKRNLSTTRRGAGYSIMLLNLVRNDASDGRKLLQRAMEILLSELREKQPGVENFDNLEAVMLHYLCVLVKDSSLVEDMLPFVPEILRIAFQKIDSEEWTVRNGALQLCGAMIPKIVGQKMHYQEEEDWQPVKLSVDDVRIRLSTISAFLLTTLTNSAQNSTTLLITILELLSRIEFWWTEIHSAGNILAFRAVLWGLLEHPCHKIRLLSARCFSGFHEFHQIPGIVFQIIELLPQITNPNLFHGLLMATDALTRKYRAESFAIPTHNAANFLSDVQEAVKKHWEGFPEKNLGPFIRINLKKFLQSIESELAGKIDCPEQENNGKRFRSQWLDVPRTLQATASESPAHD
uniref:Putative death-receptor fusion protein n=1 Tax=Lutzomyia longipalpis TaxID=7200 RepID=A0A1B0GKQ2_LUTLO